MITEDQREIEAFLASPATHGGDPVERIDTHASVVFLAGSRALKLKRAVKYDYLDFSTAARRRAMCEAELKTNQRMAPMLYRRVLPVTREADGSLALDGAGAPVDWLLEMRRFDQEALLDRLAERGALDLSLMRPLAAAIVRLHAGAERRPDQGGEPGMRWVVDGNAAGFAEQGALLDETACRLAVDRARHALARHASLLEARREAGRVRHCHGDLHLRNLVLLDGQPTLFDAVEFNDAVSCTDTAYDLAFLLMDLWHRELPAHANAVLNGALALDPDYEALALLPLFLSCRAAVRAKTSAAAAMLHAGDAEDLRRTARDYLSMAASLLDPAPPCLVAVGGLSGTGKSTLAFALAPTLGAVPGAVVVRSDEVRKALAGVDALARLGPESYTPEASARVYARVLEVAGVALRGGHAVVADAVWSQPGERAAIERMAREAGVPFVGIWLEAPESVLASRVDGRQADVSDAGADVVRQQIVRGTGAIAWARLDAARDRSAIRDEAVSLVRAHAGGSLVAEGVAPPARG